MEIKEGMYVRLKANNVTYIRQIIEVCKDIRYATYKVDKPFCNQTGLSPKKIIKASYNLIDLIEIGDYVNGYKVLDVDYGKAECFIGDTNKRIEQVLWTCHIKSIVTHEQYESMQYKVGE